MRYNYEEAIHFLNYIYTYSQNTKIFLFILDNGTKILKKVDYESGAFTDIYLK